LQVYALIGMSGTGKSHRASLVAYEYDIDMILDDGLLIKNTKIIAGRSSKREQTRIGAVKRAIFADPDHVAEVQGELDRHKPKRLLILGTSRRMVSHIVRALDLPAPVKYIRIEDIASPVEIRRALRARREQNKHVIPAPTFEVKKTFSGYFIAPLRLRFLGRQSRAEVEVEKSVVKPTYSSLGRFYIADRVVRDIAARAAAEVPGVSKPPRVSLQAEPEGVIITAEMTLVYGVNILEVLRLAQQNIRRVVEDTTALNVLKVNVIARRIEPGTSV